MFLQNVITHLKKHWKIYVVGLVVFILVISAILRTLTPAAVPIPSSSVLQQNVDGSKTTFQNITFSGTAPPIPGQLKTYAVQNVDNYEQEVLSRLLQQFSLQPTSAPNVWTGPQYSLTKDKSLGFYILNQNSLSVSSTFIDKDRAVSTAQNLIGQIFPDLSIQADLSGMSYLGGGFDPAPVDEKTAKIIHIPFAVQLDSYPVFYNNQREFPFAVQVNSSNDVQQLFFYPQFFKTQPVNSFSSLSPSQALNNIQAGKATIIGRRNNQPEVINLNQISSADLQSMNIEYRVDNQSNLALPYFRFTGQGHNTANQEFEFEVITPAIPTVTTTQ